MAEVQNTERAQRPLSSEALVPVQQKAAVKPAFSEPSAPAGFVERRAYVHGVQDKRALADVRERNADLLGSATAKAAKPAGETTEQQFHLPADLRALRALPPIRSREQWKNGRF